jgi:hypothetical protein
LILDLTIFLKDSSSGSEVWQYSKSLEILQDKLTAFKEDPLESYLEEHKVNNIRVISRIINAEIGFIAIDFMSITN